MPVTRVDKDPAALSMTLVADFDAPVDRCWQLWADPRRLERWWGPPTYPATFVEHDLTPGAFVTYFMTGPEGDRSHAWWRITSVDPPHAIELEDGFGETPGDAGGMPLTRMRMTLEPVGAGSRMTIVSTFGSTEQMEQLLSMGMEEGITAAVNQADGVLADG